MKGSPSTLEISVRYPKENPAQALDDIARALGYLGIFEGIDMPT